MGCLLIALKRGREKRGFPSWDMVCECLNPDSEVEYPKDKIVGNTEIKNPEVPFREDYEN